MLDIEILCSNSRNAVNKKESHLIHLNRKDTIIEFFFAMPVAFHNSYKKQKQPGKVWLLLNEMVGEK